MRHHLVLTATLTALTLLSSGCRVETHKDGDSDNVKVATPFGGLSVKTNQAAVQSNVGLASYPGATIVKKEHDNDGAADVNLSFGNFHLGVKALSYRTSDAPDKVMAFYRHDLGKYGAVIQCKNDHVVGAPTVTQDGLRCDDDQKDKQNSIHNDVKGELGELRAGSRQHQHIVSIDREGGGTKFSLVALDLPGHLDGDSKDKDGDSQ